MTPLKAVIFNDILIKQGSVIKVVELLKAKDADLHQGHLLIAAIETENLDLVRYLINEKVNCNEIETDAKKGETSPLIKAIQAKDGGDIFQAILAEKPELNQTVNVKGRDWTPLAFAIKLKRFSMSQQLIAQGANVDRGVQFGDITVQTPLSLAIKKSDVSLVKLLIEKNADVNLPFSPQPESKAMLTPLTLSILMDEPVIFHTLLENHADVNQQITLKSGRKTSPLGLAVLARRLKLGKRLVRRGADVNSGVLFRNELYTPVGLAFATGHGKFVKFLLNKGADISALDDIGLVSD